MSGDDRTRPRLGAGIRDAAAATRSAVPAPWKCALAGLLIAVLTGCSNPVPPVSAPAASSSRGPVSVVPPVTPAPATTLPSGPPPVASGLVAPAPTGSITAAQLGSPEAAASAWLSRWCAYDWHAPLGTRENRAHPAMTARAWLDFDPLTAPTSAKAWAVIVGAHQSAVCSAPVALVSPEAPRSATGAYVIVTANRVITPQGGAPVVEQVRETRQVLLREGRWLVDIAANGAG